LFFSQSLAQSPETTLPPAIRDPKASLRNAPEEPPPPPSLTVAFEFEGIPQALINRWSDENQVKVIQKPLQFDEAENITEPADLYILTPRTIPQFIENQWAAAWSESPDKASINPTFTNHRFDPQNEYALPWRWTPMVLLKHKPVKTDPNQTPPPPPQFDPTLDPVPLDAALRAHLIGQTFEVSDISDYLPDSKAYQVVWDTFREKKLETAWLPAAYLIQNTPDSKQTFWSWSIPHQSTVIFFDHLLISPEPEMPEEALSLAKYLLQSEQQKMIMQQSGYLPVVSSLGKELQSSTIPLPPGNWIHQSQFILLKPLPKPEPEDAAPADEITPGTRFNLEDSESPSPAPEIAPPAQTVY
ncbi:MAG: hypothetical protein AAF558_10150, partial [Verrucomicrobiota bacterium]